MLAKDTLLVSVAMKAQLLRGTEGSAGAGGGAVGGGEDGTMTTLTRIFCYCLGGGGVWRYCHSGKSSFPHNIL